MVFLNLGELAQGMLDALAGAKTETDEISYQTWEVFTLPETNIAHENPIFPCKYHQNGGFSMAMLVSGRVSGWWQLKYVSCSTLLRGNDPIWLAHIFRMGGKKPPTSYDLQPGKRSHD